MHTQRTKIMLSNKIRELVSICVAHSMEEIDFRYIITIEYNTFYSKVELCVLHSYKCDVIEARSIWNVKDSKATSVSSQIKELKSVINHYINLNREWNLSKAK